MTTKQFNLDTFVRAYVGAALWSSNDEYGNPLDDVHSVDDVHPDTIAKMREDCADFVMAQESDLREYCKRMRDEQWSGEELAGHDFWLTRNGHGAGFWDRGMGELGERLSAAAEVYSSVDLYIGDDGMAHQ